MKILLLYQTPWWNATAYYGTSLAAGLKKAGHDVWFATKQGVPAWEKAVDLDINTYDIDLKSYNPFKVIKQIVQLAGFIRKHKIDVVNTLSPEGHLFYQLASKLYRLRAPLIRSCCDARKPKRNLLNYYLYGNADRLIFPCKSNRERYSEMLQTRPYRSSVIYPALDIEKYDANKPVPFIKKKFEIDDDAFILGNVARLSPEKGHEFFLKVAAKVADKIPGARFVIVGKEEQISIESLQRFAENKGIGDKVFFTGFVPDPRGIIEEFTLGIITSRFSETISRAAMEFMAGSKPVFATDVNVLGEIIAPEKNGFTYDINDSEGMAEGIISLLQDKEKLGELGISARATLEEKYNLDRFAKRTLEVYEKAVFASK